MSASDWLGWSAAALTLLAFAARDMAVLRLTALAANLSFMAYGATAQLWPVLVLHLVLVPLNLLRLLQLRQASKPQSDNLIHSKERPT
jgi:CRP/FNR family cyclic AMP-dependent transcriptional regulator